MKICEVCGHEWEPEIKSETCPSCKAIRMEKYPGQAPRKSGVEKPMEEVPMAPVRQVVEKKEFQLPPGAIPVGIAAAMIILAIGVAIYMQKNSAVDTIKPTSSVTMESDEVEVLVEYV